MILLLDFFEVIAHLDIDIFHPKMNELLREVEMGQEIHDLRYENRNLNWQENRI